MHSPAPVGLLSLARQFVYAPATRFASLFEALASQKPYLLSAPHVHADRVVDHLPPTQNSPRATCAMAAASAALYTLASRWPPFLAHLVSAVAQSILARV